MKNHKVILSHTKQPSFSIDKPLPVQPISTIPSIVTIDDVSRTYMSRMLKNWLNELNIPLTPWFDILADIYHTILEKNLNYSNDGVHSNRHSNNLKSDNQQLSEINDGPINNGNNALTDNGDKYNHNGLNTVYIQTFTINNPKESKFLSNVYFGSPINNASIDENDKKFALPISSLHFPVGGTIRIYGLSELMLDKFVNIVESLVYLAYSLYLENYVMKDNHVKLTITSPQVSLSPQSISPALEEQKARFLSNPTKSSKSAIKGDHRSIKAGLIDFFFGHKKSTLSKHDDTIVTRNTNHLNNTNTNKIGMNLSQLSRKYSSSSKLNDKQGHKISLPLEDDCFTFISEDDPHRFYKLKKRVDNALISSSPDCLFTYPHLLNRLESEEIMLMEQRKLCHLNMVYSPFDHDHLVKPALISRRRSSILSTLSNTLKRNSTGAHQMDAPTTASSMSSNSSLPQSKIAYSPLRTTSLLPDSRKGLDHLLLDTASISSFKQHQSITLGFTCYPIGCPDKPCLGPILTTIDYFQFDPPPLYPSAIYPHTDFTLGQIIRYWAHQTQISCQFHIDEQTQSVTGPLLNDSPLSTNSSNLYLVPNRPSSISSKLSESSVYTVNSSAVPIATKSNRHCNKFHGCSQLLIDHVYSFTHGPGKVNIYQCVDDEILLDEKKAMSVNEDYLYGWITCSACDISTERIFVNDKTQSFSFAKYLELVFYSTRFSKPEKFCHCNQLNKSSIVRCFSYQSTIFKLTYENNTCYELRIPKLQVVSNAASNKISLQEPRLCPHTLRSWKNACGTEDVDTFFQSVISHLDLLSHYTRAESRRKIRQAHEMPSMKNQLEAEMVALEQDIKALRQRLDADHMELVKVLQDIHMNELNDFRRYFAMQSESILEYLSSWQETHCTEVKDECGWERPDYMKSDIIHCFPGSSVLVREDEPTSIIAYTLSCNEYIHELLLDSNNEEFSEKVELEKMSGSIDIPTLSPSAMTTANESNNVTREFTANVNKKLPPQILDGYYSSIERKYVSPSTGTSTETASFRTMVLEVCKSSVVEAQITHSKRFEDLKARIWGTPWIKRQEEARIEPGGLKRQLTERTLKSMSTAQHINEQTDSDNVFTTKEVKVSSYYVDSNDSNSTASQNKTNSQKKDVSPHIEYKFVHNGMEFTCIVYYAKQFELLRRQCNIHQLMVESLSRCQSWEATGGKSKSTFYKSKDDRLVIKEMMNAWNVVEKDAFLKFAPRYFEHMEQSSNVPSVLAKIFGFFTIRMKSTIDKKATLNLDLLVMEHLFYGQNIIRRFDFKGIQDRHVDECRKQQKDATLWDGDWLNEYRTRLLVNEQSKAVLDLAIMSDTEFLAKCNIMDYSLLIGIDEERHEMTVGIVDFIGAYTWYKKLESKSKSTLQPRKEVTIVPPDQYKIRFCREVCDYFIAVPGKFDMVEPSVTLPSMLI
ncbi:hypothetical protein BDB01DRAFT_775799 [Pilobolus umbonatus]|nr:hypothetical protein BDB01DRAFT_775799 [Pilobolus umbonatus]